MIDDDLRWARRLYWCFILVIVLFQIGLLIYAVSIWHGNPFSLPESEV